jgi:hypothetical protein
VLAAWRQVIGKRGEVLLKDEAFAQGWFGEVDTEVRPRIGDVLVACREDHAVMVTSVFPYEQRLVGMHGSLTPVEMLVPVAVG